MTEKKDVTVYSCGGFGREVAWILDSKGMDKKFNMLGYIEDNEALQGNVVNGHDVFSLQTLKTNHSGSEISVAIGNPATRKKVVEKCIAEEFGFATIIHPNVEMSQFVDVGEGSIICAGSILTVNINIGKQVHINLDCTIGHDVIMEDYVTLAPGVHVSGNVHMEENVYIGTGANIINGTSDEPLIIRKNTVIGAGACLTKSTEENSLYVGVPAVRKR